MNCNLLIGEEMALKILKNGPARDKYRQFLFNDEVKVNMNFFINVTWHLPKMDHVCKLD